MLLDGFALAGYRSFGADLEKIGPLTTVNLLAGQNNSGKSNVLRFVDTQLPDLVRRAQSGSTRPLPRIL
jgi:predicted ATPase